MDILTAATFLSGLSFLFYGTNCLTSPYMKNEFNRFGLGKQRIITGILQILGGAGLVVGYWFSPALAALASGGLFLLMALGVGVRIKIKDSLIASAPAFLFAVLNIYISVSYYGILST